jgi:hypothetical protein
MMAQASLPLIPQPQNVTLRTGTFKMPKKVRIFVPAYDNDSLQGVVDNFAAQLKYSFGLEVKSAVTPKRCHIELRTNPNINDEGYRLEIEESVIMLEAARPAGFFYGLPEQPIESVHIENVSISFKEDAKEGVPAMMSFLEPCLKQGLYFNNVNNVKLENVKISGIEGEEITCINVKELERE